MPISITSSSGNSYHLYQLPDLSTPEPEDGIAFTTITNEMCEGFKSSSLLGLNTGVRSWKLTFPTISTYGPSVTDPYGATVTREQYLRNLVKYNRTTGIPFAYTHNDQYYLVDIVDDGLTMAKSRGVNIYNASLTFKQRRINGETIFDLEGYSYRRTYATAVTNHYCETGHASPVWQDSVTDALGLSGTGGPTFGANPYNGHNTVRFDGSNDYFIGSATEYYDIIVAMKVNEATFGGNDGLFSDSTVADRIKGTSGGTKWQNPSLTGFQYWLNGTSYTVTDMQAPMNAFGLCHFRGASGVPLAFDNTFQVGKSIGSSFLTADIGEIFASTSPVPMSDINEITEHLMIKWDLQT